VSQTLRSSLWLEETDSLTPELFADMQLKGLTKKELLAVILSLPDDSAEKM
jgi:hypothetical protein